MYMNVYALRMYVDNTLRSSLSLSRGISCFAKAVAILQDELDYKIIYLNLDSFFMCIFDNDNSRLCPS
jgi:hypothetical protein